jgi:hypothetical protein
MSPAIEGVKINSFSTTSRKISDQFYIKCEKYCIREYEGTILTASDRDCP